MKLLLILCKLPITFKSCVKEGQVGEKETPSDVIETDEGKELKRATGQNQREREREEKTEKKDFDKKNKLFGK